MGYCQRLFFSIIFLFVWVKFCHSTQVISSTLDNQHVIVAAVEVYCCSTLFKYTYRKNIELNCDQVPNGMQVTRNSTGHVVKFDGVDWKIIQWLSAAHINTT